MKELVHFVFCLVLATAFGCYITDYGVITDNNQSRGGGGGVVNTTGKAHIQETSQTVTIWPDGTDETINFVDQAADGTATLTTYNNFSTGSEPTFHDDLYCNPDWNGCSIVTAPDDNDGNLFDSRFNPNCSGARSVCIALSTGRYYGECGRQRARFTLDEKIAALGSALQAERFQRRGLLWHLDGGNTSITARNLETGLTYQVPLFGARIEHFLGESGLVSFSLLDHAMLGPALLNFADLLGNELSSVGIEVNVEVNGVGASFTIAGGENDWVRRHFEYNARRF